MGLLRSVCKSCYEKIEYFTVNDVKCRSCGEMNTFAELYHAERLVRIGYKEAQDSVKYSVQRRLKHVGEFDSIEEWYLDFYNDYFDLKIKKFTFRNCMSKYAFNLTCMISYRMRNTKRLSKRLQKKIYAVVLELEKWEKENDENSEW